jgi:hypothetical protein
MAVTGTAHPAALLRIDAGEPGLPLSLTKPIGTGVLNAWHKATGAVSQAAIDVMTTLNARASRQALAAGIRCATDVTGFGLLGHLFKLARASFLCVSPDAVLTRHVQAIADFSWGFAISQQDITFALPAALGPEAWDSHLGLLRTDYPGWIFDSGYLPA